MRFWRKKQKWQVIAALLFAVWILMGTRKINVNAESLEIESFTGEKAVEMIHVKELLSLTGYVRGGCSPVGMKKQYTTVFDESVLAQEKVYVSGGRIGTQVCCAPADLIRAARAATAKIIF